MPELVGRYSALPATTEPSAHSGHHSRTVASTTMAHSLMARSLPERLVDASFVDAPTVQRPLAKGASANTVDGSDTTALYAVSHRVQRFWIWGAF